MVTMIFFNFADISASCLRDLVVNSWYKNANKSLLAVGYEICHVQYK
jgi:hypothetical protein